MPLAKHSCHRSVQFGRTLFSHYSRIAVLAGSVSGAVWMVYVPAAVAQTNCTEAAVRHGVCTEVYRGPSTPQPSPQQPSADDQRRKAELQRQRDIEWSSDEAADYVKRGDWDNAIRSFEEALDHDPDNEALLKDLAQARVEKARALAAPARVASVASQPPKHDQVGVQINQGSDSAEGRAIRTGPGRQGCGAGSKSALGQLKTAGTGRASVGCVMEGGTAHDDTSAKGGINSLARHNGTTVLSADQLAWYNKQPGFPKANAELERTTRLLKQAQQRRATLDHQIAAAPDPKAKAELVIKRSDAVQEEQTAKGAEVIAANARIRLIETLPGPPIIRPRH